ncbi:family 16 glycosylhydrolase [Persicobacter diffluens]|uniref:GH16 domain-containing protein n=1 Tax=Persicobacter diffluens TaxID=981 RepID=A0AAN4W1M4_9BACT|nr:hypothetical protein PEDI_36130 [Persicobacter diffluens]
MGTQKKQPLKACKLFALLCLFSFWNQFAFAQKPTKTENPNDQWDIKWSASDEFNGDSPDWSKWMKSSGLPNTTAWKWDNNQNAKIKDGVLELTMRQNPNNTPDGGTYFKSGILKSYNTFTYGYFEAKIKGAAIGEGVCPSFWLYSNFDYSVKNGETVYSEIDVVELQQFDWMDGHQDDIYDMDHNLHAVVMENGSGVWRRPKAYPDEQLNKFRAPWDPTKGFHIYGCEVNENEIIWYVDGAEVARKPNTLWHRPMNVTLSLGLRKPFVEFYDNRNNAIDPESSPAAKAKLSEMPTSMYVEYVRVWEKKEGGSDLETGKIYNPGFESGNLNYWTEGSGLAEINQTHVTAGNYAVKVNNGSVAQLIQLKANTTYTITADAKVTNTTASTFMGINDAATNATLKNFAFNSTAFKKGSLTFTTANAVKQYKLWFWSAGEAFVDNFNISEGGDSNVAVESVSLSSSSAQLQIGESINLQATVSPSNATNTNVSWTSSNKQVASVNNGKIVGLAQGNATITVTTADGNKTATCTIQVKSDEGGNAGGLPQAGQIIWLSTLGGDIVSLNTSSNTLEANKSQVGTLEQFRLYEQDGYFALQAVQTDKYVTTATDNTIKCGATGIYDRQKVTFSLNANKELLIKAKINNQYFAVNGQSKLIADGTTAAPFLWGVVSDGQTLRVLNNELQEGFSLYPNPYSNGLLNIELAQIQSGQLAIFDESGVVVYLRNFQNQKALKLPLSKAGLTPGLYIVKINTPSQTMVNKLLIQ